MSYIHKVESANLSSGTKFGDGGEKESRQPVTLKLRCQNSSVTPRLCSSPAEHLPVTERVARAALVTIAIIFSSSMVEQIPVKDKVVGSTPI